MKWLEFIPPQDLLQQAEGIEKGLRQNKRIGRIGWIGFIGSLFPILLEVIKWWGEVNWEDLKTIPWSNLLNPVWIWQQLSFSELLLIPLLSLTVFIFLIIWNRFWLRESNTPFRYTFSLEEFKPVLGENLDVDKYMALLSHHLCDKINERIGRLLLLDEAYLSGENKNGHQAHIHISGYYTKRKDRNGNWILEIMPRVRIGPPGNPETLAYPIQYPLGNDSASAGTTGPPAVPLYTETEKYDQILERLYFTVATEIYKQIKLNVKQKIDLLPNDYFRAVALFYEAEDYARSNTLEAYDEAQKLYAQSIYQFDSTLRPFSAYRGKKILQQIGRFLTRLRRHLRRLFSFIFPRLGTRELMQARSEIGYARMILFRRNLAGILGQKMYPVFETRTIAERAARRIERLPEEVPGKTQYLFDAYVTCALSWTYLGSVRKARHWLDKARMLAPNLAADDPHYNFVYGEVESHLRTELQIFQRVVELEPRFEVAQFSLADKAEYLWRTRPSLERNVAEMVLKQYEEVLKLNPGNVGAWANRGYIRWLLGEPEDLQMALEDYRSGREYKDIKRETFVAELDHGLARVAAEKGDFVKAYEYYTSAASANVTQAISNYIEYYYLLINDAILRRYRHYLATVEQYCKTWENFEEPEREFRELVAACCAGEAGQNGTFKKLNRFIEAVFRQNSLDREKGLSESLHAKIKENEKLFGEINEGITFRQFLTLLQKKLGSDLTPAELQVLSGIVIDRTFVQFMETQLEGKANRRIRNSILAYAYNDYGDACYYYYRQEGDERFYDRAREAYERAVALNSLFVIPYFNLQRLSTWKWDFEKSRQYLEPVIRLEPNWPDGKLVLAEVNSRLTEDKQNKAKGQQQQADKKQQEIESLEDEIRQHNQEAEQLREKVSRKRERRLPEVASAGMEEAGKTGGELFKAVYHHLYQAPDTGFLQPHVPGTGFSPAPAEKNPEERALIELQKQVNKRNREIQKLKGEIEEHQQNAQRLLAESKELAEEALNNLRSLLPHHSFWITEKGQQRFNFDAIALPDSSKWENELNHLHINTLYYLALVLKSQKQPEKAETLLSFIQQHFWPTEVYELRSLLENRVRENVFKNPAYEDLRQNDLYRRLLNDENSFALLLEKNHRELSRKSGEYRELMQNKTSRDFMRGSDHQDFLRYLFCRQTLFDLGENWLLTSQYPYWALNYIAFDSAFSTNREGPLLYHGFKFKTLRDCFLEAALGKNRSEYFYYWLGAKTKELGFEEDAMAVWTRCTSSKDPHISVKLAANFKSLERWQDSLELYRQAMKQDRRFREKSKAEYHHQCGSLLWIMGSYAEALKEFEKIESSRTDYSRRMADIVNEVLPHTNTRESYDLLKKWLHSREAYFAKKDFHDAREDARSARMQLIRDKYPQVQTDELVPLHVPAPMMSVVTPVAVEIEAGLFAAPAAPYSDDHPLLKIHYPGVQRGIEGSFGLSVPRLRVRVNDSGMTKNTYIIMIMEVPIVQGTVEPGKKFLPEYRQFHPLLTHFNINIQAAYDPRTGEMGGIWLRDDELDKIRVSPLEALDPFQYIAAHLEAVVVDHFSSFLDLQKTDDILALWQSLSREKEAESRGNLVAAALPDLSAKIRLVEVLQWLLNEKVPILNLRAILEALQVNDDPKTDISLLVDAVRLSIRDELPGNDSSFQFLALSPEFEAAVKGNLRIANAKILFAIEPQPTQDFLAAVRDVVSAYRHWKTVIVTRTEGIRFHVRRLLELEFPRVRIISLQELKPELRKLISKTIDY
jgi:hypothetical protein